MPFKSRLTDEMIRHYRESGYWGTMTWGDYVDQNAARYPDREAIIDRKYRWSFADFKRLVDLTALGFLDLGIEREEIVAVQLPNWAEFMVVRFALSKIGAVSLPLNVRMGEHELEYFLAQTKATCLVLPAEFGGREYVSLGERLQAEQATLRNVVIVGGDGAKGMTRLEEMFDAPYHEGATTDRLAKLKGTADDIELLAPTSGTTQGRYKISMKSHNSYMSVFPFYIHQAQYTQDDRILSLAPITQPMGANAMYLMAYIGSTVVQSEHFSADSALALLEAERCTSMFAISTHLVDMTNCPTLNKYDLSELTRVISAGAYVPPEVARQVESKMGAKTLIMYGAMDGWVGTGVTTNDAEDKRHNTIGRAMPGCEVAIFSEDASRQLPQGEVGEIAGRSPANSLGYFNDPEADLQVFRVDDWAFNGDLGLVDDEGYVKILGRSKDIIIQGGQNIVPTELEDLLMTHPKVANVAVIGMPDHRLGEVVCAYVILKSDVSSLTLEELVEFLKEHKVAPYKLPRRLELVDSFPTHKGDKVLKTELVEDVVEKLKAEGKVKDSKS